MKLSENTLTVLKNFAAINNGIVLEKGNVQKTINPEKSILVEAKLEDAIPSKVGIYDLNQFLGTLSTLNSPTLSFTDKNVVMTDETDGTIFEYGACSTELIVSPPDRPLTLKDPEVTFELPNAVLTKHIRLATMNSLPNLSVVGKNNKLSIQIHEKSNDLSNKSKVIIGDYKGKEFTATFKTDNLKLIPDDYKVEIKSGAFARFTSKTKKLIYFIALETK